MKRRAIGIATAAAFLVLSGATLAQKAAENASTDSSNPCPTGASCARCDSVSGAEKEQCLREQSQNSSPREVPASSSSDAPAAAGGPRARDTPGPRTARATPQPRPKPPPAAPPPP